jgi:hypothetical protein
MSAHDLRMSAPVGLSRTLRTIVGSSDEDAVARKAGLLISRLQKLLRGSFDPDEEIAERLTTVRRFPPRVSLETAELSDVATVRAWVRGLRREHDVQVHVRRRWGTLAVVADRRNPITVIVSDQTHSWVAEVPGAPDKTDLTPDQIEHVTLDALRSPERPAWPQWRPLM